MSLPSVQFEKRVGEATPKSYHELARAEVLGGKCWTMPVVSNGKIYVRNTQEAACLDVTVKTAAK